MNWSPKIDEFQTIFLIYDNFTSTNHFQLYSNCAVLQKRQYISNG